MPDLQQKIAKAEHRSDELLQQKQIIVSDNQVQAQRFAPRQQEHLALLRQHEACNDCWPKKEADWPLAWRRQNPPVVQIPKHSVFFCKRVQVR